MPWSDGPSWIAQVVALKAALPEWVSGVSTKSTCSWHRNDHPNDNQPFPWARVLVEHSSNCPNDQKSCLQALCWRKTSKKEVHFQSSLFPVWAGPRAASGHYPNVPIRMGPAQVLWCYHGTSPKGPSDHDYMVLLIPPWTSYLKYDSGEAA